MRQVISDPTNRRVTVTTNEDLKKKTVSKAKTVKPKQETADSLVGQPCPVCGQGTIIKGKTAYGCSRWKEGCTFRRPFTQ